MNKKRKRLRIATVHYQWRASAVTPGAWICCFGPQTRWIRGVISDKIATALSCADSAVLEAEGLEWREAETRTWRQDWPRELWPADRRRLPDLVRELARKHGVRRKLDTVSELRK